MDTLTVIRAAMFSGIGQQTKISRSGHSIVFIEPQLGRHDLSELSVDFALAQARAAGLDVAAVTPGQAASYRDWHERIYHARRIDDARIVVTRPYNTQLGHELVSVNGVRLIDGWGDMIDYATIETIEFWNPDATDRMGRRGAYCHRTDTASIDRMIESLRARHPDFSRARVQDNN